MFNQLLKEETTHTYSPHHIVVWLVKILISVIVLFYVLGHIHMYTHAHVHTLWAPNPVYVPTLLHTHVCVHYCT